MRKRYATIAISLFLSIAPTNTTIASQGPEAVPGLINSALAPVNIPTTHEEFIKILMSEMKRVEGRELLLAYAKFANAPDADIEKSKPLAMNFIDDLPSELIMEVFKFLDLYTLVRCSEVRKQWTLLSRDLALWQSNQVSIDYYNVYKIWQPGCEKWPIRRLCISFDGNEAGDNRKDLFSLEYINQLCRSLPHLQDLTMENFEQIIYEPLYRKTVSKLFRLTSLDIDHGFCAVGAVFDPVPLTLFENLQSLRLGNEYPYGIDFRDLPRLQELTLSRPELAFDLLDDENDDKVAAILKSLRTLICCPLLTTLNIGTLLCPGRPVADHALSLLGNFNELETLNISQTPLREIPSQAGNPTNIKDLNLSRTLKRLNLSGTNLEASTLRGLTELINLTDLTVSNSSEMSSIIFECQLLLKLRRLSIIGEDATTELPLNFNSLPVLTNINSLYIEGYTIHFTSGPGGEFPNVTQLTLRNCNLNGSLATIKAPKLRELIIVDNHIDTDNNVLLKNSILKEINNILILDLTHCEWPYLNYLMFQKTSHPVTVEGIKYFTRLNKIRYF